MKVIIKTDGKVNPIQITSLRPHFSFYIEGAKQGVKVLSYRLIVGCCPEYKHIFFDSGLVESDLTQNINYGGESLENGKIYYVRAFVDTNRGQIDSGDFTFETPIKELGGKWIKTAPYTDGLPVFGYSFNLDGKEVESARLYATALGLYEPWLNGAQVGDGYLAPGWTDYKYEVAYQTYDITNQLVDGKNNLVVYTGKGWYAGRVLHNKFNFYGKTPLFRGEIVIKYTDGTEEIIESGKGFKCIKHSPYRHTDNFDGEIYDANYAGDFSNPEYDLSDWIDVVLADDKNSEMTNGGVLSAVKIIADRNEQTRCYDEIKPVSSFYNPGQQVTVFDMGQNFGGTFRVLLRGQKGTKFTFRMGEMLDNRKGGTPVLYVENLRTAKATDEYIKGTDDPEIYEPKFTFHGYRYLEVTGTAVTDNDILGVPYCSDMEPVGKISTGVANVNKLFSNILWGQRSNYISTATDCPQRDERGGWTGDAEVFCGTAVYNFDINHFMDKYTDDLITGQQRSRYRSFPDWAPSTQELDISSPAWGDAGVIIPMTMYETYGDKRILLKSFPAMRNWVECIKKVSEKDGVLYDHSYGDWLSIVESPKTVTDTAFYAHSLKLVSQAAAILGYKVDECKYADEFERIKKIYNEKFVTADYHVFGNTQTVYCLTLAFDLVDNIEGRNIIAKRLAADVQKNGNKITGGFIGISYINKMLSKYGYGDIAYNLLLQEEYPSWIYPILQGATTIWERWNSYTHTKGFGDVCMNSFNHYSMGAVGEWMYKYMVGIRSKDGFKNIILEPTCDARMGYVSGSYKSPYGKITAEWGIKDGVLKYTCTIPANTKARLVLPMMEDFSAGGEGITFESYMGGKCTFSLESGTYAFSGKYVPTVTPDLTDMVDYTIADSKRAFRKSEVQRGKRIALKYIKGFFKKA